MNERNSAFQKTRFFLSFVIYFVSFHLTHQQRIPKCSREESIEKNSTFFVWRTQSWVSKHWIENCSSKWAKQNGTATCLFTQYSWKIFERKKCRRNDGRKQLKNTNEMLRFRSIFNNSAKLRKNQEPVKGTPKYYEICSLFSGELCVIYDISRRILSRGNQNVNCVRCFYASVLL